MRIEKEYLGIIYQRNGPSSYPEVIRMVKVRHTYEDGSFVEAYFKTIESGNGVRYEKITEKQFQTYCNNLLNDVTKDEQVS